MEDYITNPHFRRLLMLDTPKEDVYPDFKLKTNDSYACSNYLITGPSKCGKTSFLFEIAFTYAELGKKVLYIAQKPIESLPMLLCNRNRPGMNKLKNIEMVYIETLSEFITFQTSVHLRYKVAPDLMIIDGLDAFYNQNNRGDNLALATKTCALAVDAAAYFRMSGSETSLMASVTSPENKQSTLVEEVLQRWFPKTIHYYRHHSSPGFFIRSMDAFAGCDSDDSELFGTCAKLENGYIMLECC